MARGGITKASVMTARETLVSKGVNPSIDAVRLQLGSTGSKSTIHKYLKEIEESESTRLDDEVLLSKPIKELVSRLTQQLHSEANAIVDKSTQKFTQEIDTLKTENKEAKADFSALSDQHTMLVAEKDELNKQLEQVSESDESNKNALSTLKAVVLEKDQLIESIEEKHTRAYESLTHYRESVKSQREQDSRKHENDVQQLQAQIRQLNETLSVKQSDITDLNKTASRLSTELNEQTRKLRFSIKDATDIESRLNAVNHERNDLKHRVENLELLNTHLTNENASLHKQLTSVQNDNHELSLQLATTVSEIRVKTELLNSFVPSSR